MSTTTQILFNSPALHSLKRDQLVKLCKIHLIKASGKNVELIEKLKKHAETLPRDSPLSLAARGEGVEGEDVKVDEGGEDETMEEGQATEKDQSQSSNAQWGFQMPRPSEQWEVVMESIEEIEERSSQGTLSSLRTLGSTNGGSGEFGTGMSKSSSVSSSIKALASSFGLKRGGSSKSTLVSSSSFPSSSSSKSMLYLSSRLPKDDELDQHATPYSSLPEPDTLPQSDHFTFDHPTHRDGLHPSEPPSPLPGHALRPGVPAPMNARLSLGLNHPSTPTRKDQPTTTIRLISNPVTNDDNRSYGRTPQLKPFVTSFDLVLGSPQPATGGFRGVSLWPPEGGEEKGIYPPLPFELPITSSLVASSSNKMDTDEDEAMPGSLAHKPAALRTPGPSKATTTATTTAQLAVPDPFIFGSPLPQHNVSNAQFKSAAASVLEEMNKRLQNEGVDGVGMDLISRLQPGAHAQGMPALGTREAKEAPKTSGVKAKFNELHAEEFDKMEGIDSFVRRRAAKDAGEAKVARDKRKSSVGHGVGRDRFGRRVGDGASGRISATRVISSGRRPRVIPGSFDDEDSDVEDEETGGAGEGTSKRARVDSTAMVEDAKPEDGTKAKGKEEKAKVEEEERKQKEKEAIRRKLELNKARRRSSVGVAGARGRVSVGRGGVLLKPQALPAKPSRFGFLSSAKSLVQKVWNGGKTTTASSSNTGGIAKSAAKLSKTAPVPAPGPAQKKISLVGNARPSTAANPPASRVSSLRVDKEKPTSTIASTSSRARSPIPMFGTSSSTRSSLVKRSRTNSTTGTGASSRVSVGVSSVGTRSSIASSNRLSAAGGVGSMGSKKLSTGPTGRASAAGTTGSSSSRLSSRLSSSRLLAPTASSLAKTTRPSVSGSGSGSSLKTVVEGSGTTIAKLQSAAEALGMITNSPGMAKGPAPGPGLGPWSPRPGGIFSKPFTTPSGIPTPVKKRPTPDHNGGAADGKDTASTSSMMGAPPPPPPPLPARQRSITGRKPRISRSKVIAKLASQRAAGAGVVGAVGGTPSSSRGPGPGRTRSSLGAKAQRSSFGGKPGATKMAGDGVMMSAKKRARQSEYARRRSKVAPIDLGAGAGGQEMDVDAE
ncbi:hypothetical protein D9615_003209 [Tricholomella constricta]|uniref:SAP domain-containing protein n=1 Tax=Tricholomella constricta TaxID=117010 RepID=A0A8H5HIQ0_9AGAR|nr:hypothetical protein D9615_003209 [Tricholomella constricta]